MTELAHRADGERLAHLDLLHHASLFRSLDQCALASLAAVVCPRSYGRGEPIDEPAGASGSVFIVGSGRVRLYRPSCDGRELTLAIVRAGDPFGFLSLDGQGVPWSLAQTVADGTLVYRLSRHHFDRLIEAHPQVLYDASVALCNCLAEAFDRLEELAYHDVRPRLAHLLARLAASNAEHVVTETHEELACLIGATRVTVSKELGYLRRLGLIACQTHQQLASLLPLLVVLGEGPS